MAPMHGNEYLAFERIQRMQSEREQRRLMTSLKKSRPSQVQHLIGRFGTLIVALGTKMQQFEQRCEDVV
jgi:hypothetical protein